MQHNISQNTGSDLPSPWDHDHAFHTGSEAAERGTRWVMWIMAANREAKFPKSLANSLV